MLKQVYQYLCGIPVRLRWIEGNNAMEVRNVATKKSVVKKKKKVGKSRSAVTGKYVSSKFAEENKATTVKERK